MKTPREGRRKADVGDGEVVAGSGVGEGRGREGLHVRKGKRTGEKEAGLRFSRGGLGSVPNFLGQELGTEAHRLGLHKEVHSFSCGSTSHLHSPIVFN